MPPARASGVRARQPVPPAQLAVRVGRQGPGWRSVERRGREGEHEERLGGLLEGGLGEVGGGEVGEGDQRRRRAAAVPGQPAQRPERGQPGQHPDRDDLAEEGLAEADPGDRGGRHRQPVRAQRVAGVRRRAEAAAQPLGPGQVQAEVVVEADPEQAPAAADHERDRQHEERRRAPPAGPRAGRRAPRRAAARPRPRRRPAAGRRRAWRWSRAPAPAPAPRSPSSTAARPTAGSSQDHVRRPASASSARPTSSEAAQISAAEA